MFSIVLSQTNGGGEMHYSRAGDARHGHPIIRVSQEMALSSVKPVMEYLDNLQNNAHDRTLSLEEDTRVCELLLTLTVPNCPELKFYINQYMDLMREHPSRSLMGWYFFARNLAGFITHCEYCSDE